MSITLSPKTPATRLRKTPLVASAISILLVITLFGVWLVLPRGQLTIWVGRGKSWLQSEFRGPYTPTEDLLILSSAFSVAVSAILETLLLFVLRHKSSQTKTWLRYTLFTILFANAALASAAFFYASVSATSNGACKNIDSGVIADEYGRNRSVNARTLDRIVLGRSSPYDEGFQCGRRMASRWLSLLISFFSITLLVSAWLDFREQDQQESETFQFDRKLPAEKGAIPTDSIEAIA